MKRTPFLTLNPRSLLKTFCVVAALWSAGIVVAQYSGPDMVYKRWDAWGLERVQGTNQFSIQYNTTENGGTPTSLTFFDAFKNVDVDTPSAPDFTGATPAQFGRADTDSDMFGVGSSTSSSDRFRFNRGESFTMRVDRDFHLKTITVRSVSVTADLRVAWTRDGQPEQAVVPVTGHPTTRIDLTPYDVRIDANTPVVITNVSPPGDALDHRLNIMYFVGSVLFNSEPVYDLSGGGGLPQMFGVNIAGAEFTPLPFYEANREPEQWSYYASKGVELIRFPLRWHRLQPTPGGPLDVDELNHLKLAADLCAQNNLKMIIDLHDYFSWGYQSQSPGKAYPSVKIGESYGGISVTEADFRDLWRRLALEFKDHPAIYGYGLMNEPDTSGATWASAAQQAVYGIRNDAGDAGTWIILAGQGNSKAHGWPEKYQDVINVTDPSDHIMYEAHVYFDSSGGGFTYSSYDAEGASEIGFIKGAADFTNWLQASGNRGFIGEFNVPADGDPRWLEGLELFMDTLLANGLSATYWAGGSAWNNDNHLYLHPENSYTQDQPQMDVLVKYGLGEDPSNLIYVDDDDPTGVTFTGSWPHSDYRAGYFGSTYRHDENQGKGSKSIRFTPDLDVAGTYTVSFRWVSHSSYASNVPVDITHANGVSSVSVDQTTGGGQWVELDTLEFNAGTGGYLTVFNHGTSGRVIADAVRFELQTESGGVKSLGDVNDGVAARDNATGTGYILWSAQDVSQRFSPAPTNGNSSNLIAVVWDGSQWWVDNNATLTAFTPVPTDVLIAEVDFSNDTITSLEGTDGDVHGIAAGYASGDLTFQANVWRGSTNTGEFTIDGTQFTRNGEAGGETVSLGDVNDGVAAIDNATGTGYILWSAQDVSQRFSPAPHSANSSNLIAVVWDGSQWWVDNNSTLTAFTPVPTDVLIAEVDFSNDTMTSLEGTDGDVHGIAEGYASGDLSFHANVWRGGANAGEFTIEGTTFTKN